MVVDYQNHICTWCLWCLESKATGVPAAGLACYFWDIISFKCIYGFSRLWPRIAPFTKGIHWLWRLQYLTMLVPLRVPSRYFSNTTPRDNNHLKQNMLFLVVDHQKHIYTRSAGNLQAPCNWGSSMHSRHQAPQLYIWFWCSVLIASVMNKEGALW